MFVWCVYNRRFSFVYGRDLIFIFNLNDIERKRSEISLLSIDFSVSFFQMSSTLSPTDMELKEENDVDYDNGKQKKKRVRRWICLHFSFDKDRKSIKVFNVSHLIHEIPRYMKLNYSVFSSFRSSVSIVPWGKTFAIMLTWWLNDKRTKRPSLIRFSRLSIIDIEEK